MILKWLKHENIVNLVEIFGSRESDVNKKRGSFYLSFEYIEHDLSGLIEKKLSFSES